MAGLDKTAYNLVYSSCRVFVVLVSLQCVKKVFKEKIGFRHFNALRSSFKVPVSAAPSDGVDCESVRKRVWVSEWVVMSLYEVPNPASSGQVTSSGHCCFTSGEEFLSTKNKTNRSLWWAMQSSRKQSKNIKRWDVPDIIRHQSFITRSTLLSVCEGGNLKLDFMIKKASELIFLGLNKFLDVIEIPKPQIPSRLYGHFKLHQRFQLKLWPLFSKNVRR